MIHAARMRQSWKALALASGAMAILGIVAEATSGRVVAAGQATSASVGAADATKRGQYLVNAMGCTDCHTPTKMGPNGPEPDESRLLSGHPETEKLPPPPPPPPNSPWIVSVAAIGTAWSGPWGISYTRNLTPDPETGLGQWTEQQFVDTIRNGRHQGRGRQLLPPMPWQAFRNLSDEDLRAIFAYLRTITAIKNRVPDPVIAAPKPAAKP